MAALLFSVLLSLTAMRCSASDSSTSSMMASTRAADHHSALTTKHDISSSVMTPDISQHQPTTAPHISSDIARPTPSSPQTANRTEDIQPSHPPETTPTNQMYNQTTSPGPTHPPESGPLNVTTAVTKNGSSPALPYDQGAVEVAGRPGLATILCIFCIVLVLVLVVAVVKCIRSSKSSFERLEDVPMGKVNEHSPFAMLSK